MAARAQAPFFGRVSDIGAPTGNGWRSFQGSEAHRRLSVSPRATRLCSDFS
jgi:hypothetical protein